MAGADAARPFYDRAEASFERWVDPENRLGLAWGFEVVPAVFLFDESGREADRILGFDIRRTASAARLDAFLASPAAAAGAAPAAVSAAERLRRLEALPPSATRLRDQADLLLQLGRAPEAAARLEGALVRRNWDAKAWFLYGSALLRMERKPHALEAFRAALRLKPSDFLIRKQIWAIEHPERFYPEIDWNWQRGQMEKDKRGETGGAP